MTTVTNLPWDHLLPFPIYGSENSVSCISDLLVMTKHRRMTNRLRKPEDKNWPMQHSRVTRWALWSLSDVKRYFILCAISWGSGRTIKLQVDRYNVDQRVNWLKQPLCSRLPVWQPLRQRNSLSSHIQSESCQVFHCYMLISVSMVLLFI